MIRIPESKKIFLTILIIILIAIIFPQTNIKAGPPWYIGGREVPGPLPPSFWLIPQLDTKLNFVYGRANGYDLLMDFAKPTMCKKQKTPLVIFIHGGWWIGGSKSIWGTVHNMCYQLGFAVASMNYRLSNVADHPELINDCKLAVRYLRANADQFGIDPNKIAIWGASAGGHLASLCNNAGDNDGLEGPGYENYSSRPNATVNWCGITDLSKPWNTTARTMINIYLGCDPLVCIDKAKNASPVWQATIDDPPLLMIHGDADPVVAYTQAEFLADAMYKVNNNGAFIRVINGNHGLVGTSPNYNRVNWVTFAHMARYIEPGLKCDLNIDGQVNMADANELMSLMGLNGYLPNHQGADERWNPLADIVPDGKINYKDWQSFCTLINQPITIQKTLTQRNGNKYTFQVEIRNNGPLTLTNLKLVDIYPKVFTFVAGSQGIQLKNNTLELIINSLPSNSEKQYVFSFILNDSAQIEFEKTQINTSILSGDDILPISSSTTVLLPGIDIRKTSSKMTLTPEESVDFTIIINNTGKLPLTEIEVTDKFPKELEFISSRPQGLNSPGIIKFNIQNLAPGKLLSFTISLKISKKMKLEENIFLTNYASVTCLELSARYDTSTIALQKTKPSTPLQMSINWKNTDTKTGRKKIGDTLEFEVTPSGGSCPYEINVDWGDASRNDIKNTDKKMIMFKHRLEKAGQLNIKITCSDSYANSVVIHRAFFVE